MIVVIMLNLSVLAIITIIIMFTYQCLQASLDTRLWESPATLPFSARHYTEPARLDLCHFSWLSSVLIYFLFLF